MVGNKDKKQAYNLVSSILNLMIIIALVWFAYKMDARNQLIAKYLSGTESSAWSIFRTEILNYHFAKKHQQSPDTCTECAVIYKQRTQDIEEFYKDNQ